MGRLIVSVSGVRGTVDDVLNAEIAEQFGRAFATMLGAGRTIALGRDTRASGAMLRDAIVAGLAAGGVNVVDLGVISTPGVALMIKRLGADGGVVITASHNPLPYNGIKFMTPEGLGLPAGQAEQLKAIWESGKFSTAERSGTVTKDDRTAGLHVQAVLDVVDVAAIRQRKFKVVLDSINGAGCVEGSMLLRELGCAAVQINGEPTGEFAHTPEPREENLTGLCDVLREEGADVGFAQDPDADRLAIVDENGTYIGEEYTCTLTAAFVLRQRKGDIAANLSTTRMMDDVAAAAGVKVVRTPTGEANVVAAMLAHGCIFGGEGGGGAIDPRVVAVRDSLVGMALMLNYMAETGRTVSALVDAIPRYEMVKDKFACPMAAAPRILAAVKAAYAGRKGAQVNDVDGIRVDLPEGWVQVRASNTEPIMRITAEAPPGGEASRLAAEARAIADGILKEG
ncbi:MAG TPA: phosphoglucosamine mutase [Phycisphaerae bacterium]|nr:phosphoglucosamine mutase [Phycisphaerae bacterium]